MRNWNLHRPSQVVELCRRHGISTSRRLGQNFLVDANVLHKVVEAAELSSDDRVIEVGPGLGTLTRELAARAGRVIAIELDCRCFAALEETTAEFPNVERIHDDAVNADLSRCAGPRAKFVANLPYNISKVILRRVFDLRHVLDLAVIMLQREVADRLQAEPASKDYGPLAIAARLFADCEVIAAVSPHSFFPPPKVQSAIVRLRFPPAAREAIPDESWFFEVVHAALQQRRKQVANALVSNLALTREAIAGALASAEIDPMRRGETLTPSEFAQLATALRSAA